MNVHLKKILLVTSTNFMTSWFYRIYRIIPQDYFGKPSRFKIIETTSTSKTTTTEQSMLCRPQIAMEPEIDVKEISSHVLQIKSEQRPGILHQYCQFSSRTVTCNLVAEMETSPTTRLPLKKSSGVEEQNVRI